MKSKKLDVIITRDFHESIEKWKPILIKLKNTKYMDYSVFLIFFSYLCKIIIIR